MRLVVRVLGLELLSIEATTDGDPAEVEPADGGSTTAAATATSGDTDLDAHRIPSMGYEARAGF